MAYRDDLELRKLIHHLAKWRRNGKRLPHKPLFILFALSQLHHGNKQLIYSEIHVQLKSLMSKFCPSKASARGVHPFISLVSDGIWQLNIVLRNKPYTDNQLIENGVAGAFHPNVLLLLDGNTSLIESIVEEVLQCHFPVCIHEDLQKELGLPRTPPVKRLTNVDFHNRVLKAYDYRCVICDVQEQPDNILTRIYASHIQWLQAGGPDSEENGLALCLLHHKWYNCGLLTITPERQIIVSQEAGGIPHDNDELRKLHGLAMRLPNHPVYLPYAEYLNWHLREVFRGTVKAKRMVL
ncbi:phosphorothioated DNA-binding restriction endonuclease [Paenibacillus sp. YIM B09110]|uniref:phosphorothioated DNA-binding restriction endonuclease n=1 Tax=Paenibacillus sp. YIM B09110 TaxID=3126102 RepID=UPI003FA727FA